MPQYLPQYFLVNVLKCEIKKKWRVWRAVVQDFLYNNKKKQKLIFVLRLFLSGPLKISIPDSVGLKILPKLYRTYIIGRWRLELGSELGFE